MANFFTNIYNKLFGKTKMQIVILGFNGGVGKTTVLFRIKDGTTADFEHTAGYNLETVEHSTGTYDIFDIGGGSRIIRNWQDYFMDTKGVIFVIDSTDKERLEEVQIELDVLLKYKKIEQCPFLVLVNKQDLPNAMSFDEVQSALKLDQWKHRNIHVLSTVAKDGTGVTEGFEWLCSEISKTTK